MSLIHSLLAAAYPPLRLGNNLLRRFGAKADGWLRVLLYHNIAPHEQGRFVTQLRWLARSWTFVSPQQFAAMMRGNEPIKGANLHHATQPISISIITSAASSILKLS